MGSEIEIFWEGWGWEKAAKGTKPKRAQSFDQTRRRTLLYRPKKLRSLFTIIQAWPHIVIHSRPASINTLSSKLRHGAAILYGLFFSLHVHTYIRVVLIENNLKDMVLQRTKKKKHMDRSDGERDSLHDL